MSRLRHSYAGFLRYMEMSTLQVFVFVEGKDCDPFFYASICATIRQPGFFREICTADRISANSGGKQAVIGFFSYLRNRKKLTSTLGGKSTAAIFYVDKDVDDVQRIQKRSPHIVYTEYYDVQNYIFEHGDLLRGAAAAASVDPAILSPVLANPSAWCAQKAGNWREWIALCLCVLKVGINFEANYGITSRIQTRPCGALDSNLYNALVGQLQQKSRLPLDAFQQRLGQVATRVDRYYLEGQHHRIFKGKWFTNIMSDEIDQLMNGRTYDNKGLARRLPSAIAATLDFTAAWADHFRRPLLAILSML